MPRLKTHRYFKQVADFQNGLIFSLWPILVREAEKILGDVAFNDYQVLLNIAGFIIILTMMILMPKITGYERFSYSSTIAGAILQALMSLLGLFIGIGSYLLISAI